MPAEAPAPHLSWNPVSDVSQILEYHFMVNAMLASGIVAVMAGLIGWMMVVRRQTFAGHTLAMMAFPGAAAAALLAVPAAWGYFAFCGGGALAIGRFAHGEQRSWRQESASIGAVQAAALAAGFLFVSLYGGVLGDLETLLFGSVLGISDRQVLVLALLAVVVIALLAGMARPLLFSSVDPQVAGARGVPVGRIALAFLLLLGAAVAATSQVTGPLLVFALLVMPAATAQAITPRPALSLALTVLLALGVAWLGVGISYFSPYPASFFIATVAFTIYVLVRVPAAMTGRRVRGPSGHAGEPAPTGVIA